MSVRTSVRRAQPAKATGTASVDGLLTALATSADGVYAVDSQQRIVFWSAGAEKLTGRRADEVVGRPCYEVMLGGGYDGNPFCRRNCPTIVGARRGQAVPNYDLQVRNGEGSSTWFNMSIVPLSRREAGRTLAIHMFRDVTSRRRAEMLAQATLATVSRFAEPSEEPPIETEPYPVPAPAITARELEVVRLLAEGMSTAQMAKKLSVTQATVRNHVDHLLSKLGVHRRLEAALYATQHGLV